MPPPIVVRFARWSSVTQAEELALPFFKEVAAGLAASGIEDDDLDPEQLRRAFGANLGDLGWTSNGPPVASIASDAFVAAIFFLSDATGQWAVGRVADHIGGALRPAVLSLMNRLRADRRRDSSPIRLTTEVWLAGDGGRITISAEMRTDDERPIDEIVTTALQRSLATVREQPGRHVTEDLTD